MQFCIICISYYYFFNAIMYLFNKCSVHLLLYSAAATASYCAGDGLANTVIDTKL